MIPFSPPVPRPEGELSDGDDSVTDIARPTAGTLIFSDILGLVGTKLRAVEAEVARNLRSEIGVID